MAKNWEIKTETLVYDKPQKVNKFLQRYLDNAKKKVPDSFISKLEFVSTVCLSKSKSKRKPKTKQEELILKS